MNLNPHLFTGFQDIDNLGDYAYTHTKFTDISKQPHLYYKKKFTEAIGSD